MEYQDKPSTYIPPERDISKELTPAEVEQYFTDLWRKVNIEYVRDVKRGKLISKSQAGRATDAEKTMRAIFSIYLDAVKQKINALESEKDKTIYLDQVHELDSMFDSLLRVVSALNLDVDRKDLLPSLNGYIIDTVSRIKL
tara:strand:+ start:12692 stop:13114 length:423 start_codon:yes stop_codon:yes gene_type:complete